MLIRIRLCTLTLIQIRLFTLMRIRGRLFTSMWSRIRIRILIKVMRICDHFSTQLHFRPLRLHCERLRPFVAPFWASTAPVSWLCGSRFHSHADPASQNGAKPDPLWLIEVKNTNILVQKMYKTKALSEKMQVTTLVFIKTGIEVINETKIEYNQWYGSGFRRAKISHKSRKNLEISCFEVLDGLFWGLKVSSVAWTFFMEA